MHNESNRRKREKKREEIKEIMAENVKDLMQNSTLHIQEAQWTARMNECIHIIVKMLKIKEEKILKAREKQFITNKGTLIRLTGNFSSETGQKAEESILEVIKEKDL